MSRLFTRLVTGDVLTGVATKTIAQVVAPANQKLLVHEIKISFKGTVRNTPILVEILRQTTAGTMSALTLFKENSVDPETVQATALVNATAEPTAGPVLDSCYVSPDADRYHWVAPFGRQYQVNGSGRLGVRVTNPGPDVTCQVEMAVEE